MGARARGDLQRMRSRLRALTGLGAARRRRALRLGNAREPSRLADHLLRDEERLAAMRLAAYDHVRSTLPMRPAAERLIAIADSLARSPRSRRPTRPKSDLRRARLRALASGAIHPRVDGSTHGQWTLEERGKRSDAVLKRLMLGQIELKRQLAAQEASLRRGDPDEVRIVVRTPAYARSDPRISVLIPLYNHAEEVRSALASVAASEHQALEVVVLDDASTDRSQEAVRDFFATNPHLPGLLVEHVVNRGLGRTRNDLVEAARGEFVFMLDADNEIYPTALDRLADALDDDPGSFFAYPMLEEHIDGEPHTLGSFFPLGAWPARRVELHRRDVAAAPARAPRARRVHRGPAPARLGGLRPLVPDRAARVTRPWFPRSWRATGAPSTRCSTRSRTSTRARPSRSCGRATPC